MSFGPSVQRLSEEFARLPGIGPKSAERLTHWVLQQPAESALRLARALEEVKRVVRNCSVCFNLCEGERCGLCSDPKRDHGAICVVEQPRDVQALERANAFRGVYHVLLGRIAPLEGLTPDQLTLGPLLQRVKRGGVREVILATNPTVEGEGTGLAVSNLLAETGVKVTRLARGLASGLALEFANREMLEDALSGRREF